MPLPRPCRRCGERYRPLTRGQKYCRDCACPGSRMIHRELYRPRSIKTRKAKQPQEDKHEQATNL